MPNTTSTDCCFWITTPDDDKSNIHDLNVLIEELRDLDDNTPLTFFNHCEIPQCLIDCYGKETPELERQNRVECGYSHLFEFTINEWGSAFDAIDAKLAYTDEQCAFYTFRVNSAPLAWVKKLSELHPLLIFEIDCDCKDGLWDSFSVMYIAGKQIEYNLDKNDKPDTNNK